MKPKIQQKPFPDITRTYWAAPSIAAAKNIGCFEYLAGQSFGPDLKVTRAEVAEVISKTPFVKKKINLLISGN